MRTSCGFHVFFNPWNSPDPLAFPSARSVAVDLPGLEPAQQKRQVLDSPRRSSVKSLLGAHVLRKFKLCR